MSFGLALEHVTVQDMLNSPFHIISYHAIPYHIISYHIISYHIISYIISYHIISYHIISYHIISYHIISYHINHMDNAQFFNSSPHFLVFGGFRIRKVVYSSRHSSYSNCHPLSVVFCYSYSVLGSSSATVCCPVPGHFSLTLQ